MVEVVYFGGARLVESQVGLVPARCLRRRNAHLGRALVEDSGGQWRTRLEPKGRGGRDAAWAVPSALSPVDVSAGPAPKAERLVVGGR